MVRELTAGKTIREISQTVGISPQTVEAHRSNMHRKHDAGMSTKGICFELVASRFGPPMRHK